MPTPSSKQVKVLVSGDVEGKFEQLFARVKLINKKAGPFDLLLCVGEFFGSDPEANRQLISGQIEPPISTYILGPSKPETEPVFSGTESEELTANLTYLGKKGLLQMASGLTVAYLSGKEADLANGRAFDGDTVKELSVQATSLSNFRGVDVLLTSQWPESVEKYALNRAKYQENCDEGTSAYVSKVAALLKPRYHFAGLMGVHYERSPYRNHRVLQDVTEQATRFIGLAKVGNTQKAKFLYAFNIVPMKELCRTELRDQPPDTTEFPFAEVIRDLTMRERRKEEETDNGQFFFDKEAGPEKGGGGRRGGRKRGWQDEGGHEQGEKRGPPAPCWFCLSSPDVAKHMVIAVGDCSYLALAKGGLTDDHLLILPIGHIQSMVSAPDDVRAEIEKFKDAVTKCLGDSGKMTVFFERNYKSQHLQIQAVPVPSGAGKKLKTAFTGFSEARGFELNEIPEGQEIWDMVNEGCPYFSVELPSGETLFTRQMKQFPIQFGREVLASQGILNAPDKADWRACALNKEEEAANAQKFRKKFEKFDFTE